MVALIAVSAIAVYELRFAGGGCEPLGTGGAQKSQVEPRSFGAVTEFYLPHPSRWANALAVARDGSVWFGEMGRPGIGHLFDNGTLVEYPWPGVAPLANPSQYVTGIWGVALWNGMVWGANFDQNELVGLDPSRSCAVIINLPKESVFPYTLAISPEGSLWFTSISQPPILGRVSPDLSVSILNVSLPHGSSPAQVQFVSPTLAYFVAVSPSTNSGGVYAFDPENASSPVRPTPVGEGFSLVSPNSISVSSGRVWVTQHYPSSVASYNLASGLWTLYPTSTENYTLTTLPYFIEANGSEVWFNEHYGNRIALVNLTSETLTEYSEADPPITNGTKIQDDLTIAEGDGGLWFTSTTGNYVGFVSAAHHLPFAIYQVGGNQSLTLTPGGTASLSFWIKGTWTGALRVQVSDTENFTGVPRLLHMTPGASMIEPWTSPSELDVQLTASPSIEPGDYTVAVTATDGLLSQSSYVFVEIK